MLQEVEEGGVGVEVKVGLWVVKVLEVEVQEVGEVLEVQWVEGAHGVEVVMGVVQEP